MLTRSDSTDGSPNLGSNLGVQVSLYTETQPSVSLSGLLPFYYLGDPLLSSSSSSIKMAGFLSLLDL